MASIKLMETKDGRRFWKISVSRGYGVTPYTMRYYWPDGWSQRSAERELKKVVSAFELKCASGEVLSRSEQKQRKAEAEAEAAKIKTVKQYGEQVFMPAKKVDCARKTVAYYQNALDKHIYPAFGDTRLIDLSSAQLSAFFLKKQASGLSHSTVLGMYVTMNQLLTMAYMADAIDRNPLDKVKRPRQRKSDKVQNVDAFTEAEAKDIIKCAKSEPLKWRAMIYLLLMTGMRRGEACALKWDDIDYKEKKITVKGSIGYTVKDGVYHDLTKTGEARDIYWGSAETSGNDDLAEVLTQYRAEQIKAVARRTKRLEKDGMPLDLQKVKIPDYVFTERGSSEPMHPDAVNRYFKRFKEAHGIEIHAHKLRHTYATIAIANGADVASVSGNLGHKDINTTLKVYVHPTADGKRKVGNLVAGAVKMA